MSTAQLRTATVVDTGVIVSTIVEDGEVETVTFRVDPSAPVGFTTSVQRGGEGRAEELHQIALARARLDRLIRQIVNGEELTLLWTPS